MLAAVTRSPGEMVVENVDGPRRARPGHVRATRWPRSSRPAARPVVVVGMSSGAEPIRPGIFPEKEIDVLGSSTATAADFRYAISLVTSARENISKLFSHHFPLARAAEAFEFAMSRPPDAVKIVVNVN